MSLKFQLNENAKVDWAHPFAINDTNKVSSATKISEKRKRNPLTERQPIQPLDLTPAQWKTLTGESNPILSVSQPIQLSSSKKRRTVMAKQQIQPLQLSGAEIRALAGESKTNFTNSQQKHLSSGKKQKFVVAKSQIQPLQLSKSQIKALTDKDEPKPKKSKQSLPVQHSVRKNLFTKEETKTRKSTTRRSQMLNLAKSKKPVKSLTSPLVSIEEVEEGIIKNNIAFPFKSPTQPIISFTKATPLRSTGTESALETPRFDHTPNSLSSNDNEFLELERNFQEEANKIDNSPVSSVCNLLENTKIQSAKKQTMQSNNDSLNKNIAQIKKMIEIHHVGFAEMQQQVNERVAQIMEMMVEFQNKQQQLIKAVNECLENIENSGDSNNNLRRSLRLARSPRQDRNGKVVIASPVFTKSVDLRKTTLNRNLQNSTKKSREFPLKASSCIMATPKFDRTLTPNITKRTLNLRRDMQNQYSKLIETPSHK